MRHFSKAYDELQKRLMEYAKNKNSDEPLLAPLFGGDYSSFEVQRDFLERLASKGSLPRHGVDPKRVLS
jgi:non-canonical poly(A) RNA polymerase PAPD5/7